MHELYFSSLKKVDTINNSLNNDQTNSLEESSISELENFVNNVIIIIMVCDPGQGWT